MHADSILSTPTSRQTWALSHLTMAIGGTLLIMLATGAATGLGFAVVTGDFEQIPRLISALFARTPAMLVLVGNTTVIYGISQRAAPLAWACLAAVLIVGLFAGVLDFPQWVRNVSPFEHAPTLPGGSYESRTVSVITGIKNLASDLNSPIPGAHHALPKRNSHDRNRYRRQHIDRECVPDVLEVLEVPEFLEMLIDMGAHLWACKMSVDIIDLDPDDLCDGVEDIINVSDFIELSEGAQILFV